MAKKLLTLNQESNMTTDKKFPDGIMWREPHPKAPDFVKGRILIQVDKFIEQLKVYKQYQSDKGWISIDIKDSRGGHRYFELDTYKPVRKDLGEVAPEEVPDLRTSPSEDYPNGIPLDEVPF